MVVGEVVVFQMPASLASAVELGEVDSDVAFETFADDEAAARGPAGLFEPGGGRGPMGAVEHGLVECRHGAADDVSLAHKAVLLAVFRLPVSDFREFERSVCSVARTPFAPGETTAGATGKSKTFTKWEYSGLGPGRHPGRNPQGGPVATSAGTECQIHLRV